MKELRATLNEVVEFKSQMIEDAFKAFIEARELGFGAVLPNFRLLVTGQGNGPSMFDICALLGKDEVLRRMDSGLEKFANA
jgi:glutamyl-tRNA synthetase